MLHTLTEDGTAHWVCPNCETQNSAHHSHEQMERGVPRAHIDNLIARGLSEQDARAALAAQGAGIIALPPCACGARTFLKASFTAEELQARNMIDETGEPTESHAAAHRHMALHRHMEANGK